MSSVQRKEVLMLQHLIQAVRGLLQADPEPPPQEPPWEREAWRRAMEDADCDVFAPPRVGDRTREAYLRAHLIAQEANRSW